MGSRPGRASGYHSDGRLLAGDVEHLPFRSRREGAKPDPVGEADHPARLPDDDGEGAVHQERPVSHPEGRQKLLLLLVHPVDGIPYRRRQDLGDDLDGELLPPHEQIRGVGDHLGVGLEGAGVAVHLQVPAVRPVAGDLAVVDDGGVQQAEGVGSAPPGLGVRREAAVDGPGMSPVEPVEHEVLADLLGVADALEAAHVLSGAEDVGVLDLGVHRHNLGDHVVPVGRRLILPLLSREDEVPPEEGRVPDEDRFVGGDLLVEVNVELPGEESLQFLLGRPSRHVRGACEHEVEGVEVPVVGVYAVGCKAAAEAVAPDPHAGYRLHHPLSGEPVAFPVHRPEDGAGTDLLGVKLSTASSLPIHDNLKRLSSARLDAGSTMRANMKWSQ